MAQMHQEKFDRPGQGIKMGMDMGTFADPFLTSHAKGGFIFDMRDANTGEVLAHWEKPNVITYDAGILAARLFRDSRDPSVLGSSPNKGLTMLSIGTGATGNLLAPDAPTPNQRRLNNQIQRKAFSSAQFRDGAGVAVNYPTNIVDFTATFIETEAVGPLNEMGVVATFSSNPGTTNWINNGPALWGARDTTLNMSNQDLLANYLTFSVISKPATAILTITWRITF